MFCLEIQASNPEIAQNNIPTPDRIATSIEALTPDNFDTSVLAGFRKEYRSDAAITAQKTLAAGAEATEKLLQMAGWIQQMKSQLSRKEFGAFVKGLLQWVGEEARKYLDIAKTFDGFDLSRLINLEPFTLLKLRSKRYAPVVDKLREQSVITPKLVQDLVNDLLPKQSRQKLDSPQSAWKPCRSGGGRYYNVLLHDEETGKRIEQQAEAEGILPQKVIAEAVALRAKYKESNLEPKVIETGYFASFVELGDVQEHEESHTEEVEEVAPTEIASVWKQQFPLDEAVPFPETSEPVNELAVQEREVEQYLEEQATEITVVPQGSVLAGEDETEIQWLLNASLDSVEAVIRSIPVRSAYRALYLLNQFQSGDAKRMEMLSERVTEHHVAVEVVEPRQATAKEKTCKNETQTRSKDSEQDAFSSEEAEPVDELKLVSTVEENSQASLVVGGGEECPLPTEAELRVFQEGKCVEIVSARHGPDLVWQVGIIKVASAVGCVVEVLGRTVWFCVDELSLIPVTPQNPPEQEKEAIAPDSEVLP